MGLRNVLTTVSIFIARRLRLLRMQELSPIRVSRRDYPEKPFSLTAVRPSSRAAEVQRSVKYPQPASRGQRKVCAEDRN